MKTLTKRTNFVILLSMLAILFSVSSCTTIRSTDSNNFTRVKYNPHLKLKKSVQKTTVKVNDVEKLSPHQPEIVAIKGLEERAVKKPLYQSIKKEKNSELEAKASERVSESKKVRLSTLLNPIHSNQPSNGTMNNWSQLIPAAHAAVEPMASDSDLGSLIWIILVVLLVLLILGVLADLGGGLIGTLLAVLLILLILRLLGII